MSAHEISDTSETEKPSVLMRVIYALPIIGMFARQIGKNVDNFFWILPILLLCITLAALYWGAVAITMVGLFLVPCMFTFFIMITWPFGSKE